QTPAACCAAKKSGSIHISATQSAPASAAAADAGAFGVPAGPGAGVAGGFWPVVKSYPHASQKSASEAFSVDQFGQAFFSNVGASGTGGAAGGAAGAIGAPHVSQKSSVAD
ncbi:MAG: hypothetical protein QOF59_2148, partial [Actinomycetota bacterium]|nr:hypothetical protein [Actinomycetota bacterium]